MFAWSGDKDGTGKLQRQRFLKVEGIYGGAAKNLQMIYRRSHYMRLTQEGLSHEEAIIRSAGVNLRLYEDRENNIYMGANDLTYLSKTIERQDWAMKHVMERGLRLKEPKAFWAKYIDEEDVDLKTGLPKVGAEIKERQMMLEEVAELTIEESQKARGEGIRAPDGTILATIGSNPSVHDGDRLVVAKVLDWTNEPHMIVKKKVGVNPDGSISYVEVDTKNAAVIADIRTNQADYKVVDPIQMKAGITQYREVTGVREDGAVQYRSWRHFGEITYQVDGGYSRKIYAASELVGRDNALAIASGVPTDKVLAMMNPDEKRAYLVKQGANTSEEVRFMSETEVVEAAKKERESQIKKLKKQQTTDAETLTRDAAVEASGILSISDPKGEYVAQAQRSIHIHKEHQEILAEALTKKEFSRLWEEMRKANNPITDAEDERQVRLQARRTAQAQIMALKTTVYQGSQATGIGVERLVVFDDENNVNTWMISDYKDSEKVVLSVNAAHMTEDFQGFIKTSQENEIPHELTHTPAHDRMRAYYLTDKEIKKLEEGGELEGVKDPARILAHKKDRRTYQTDVVGKDRKSHDRMLRYNGASTMRNAAEEVIADTTAGDPEALRQKYEMVLEYYAGRERLDARDRMNAARIAATARKRAVSSRGTEWTDLADDMDALVKRSTARRSHLRESAKLMAKRQMEEQKLIALGVNPTRIPAMPEIVKLDGQIGVIEHEIATETTLSPKYQFYQEAEEYYGRLYDHVTTSGGTP